MENSWIILLIVEPRTENQVQKRVKTASQSFSAIVIGVN